MKLCFIFTLLVLSIFLCQAQGIRFTKSIILSSNHQELIAKTSSSNQDDASATATNLSPGINRKLMTKTIPSIPTTNNTSNSKILQNDPKPNVKFARGPIRKKEIFQPTPLLVDPKHGKSEVVPERYPDVIDITGMDYSPAKRKPPIHN